jgi:hypothetical protein
MYFSENRRLHSDQIRDVQRLGRQYPPVLAPRVSEFVPERPVAPQNTGPAGIKQKVGSFVNWFMQSEDEYNAEKRTKANNKWQDQVERDADRYLSWQRSIDSIPTRPPRGRPEYDATCYPPVDEPHYPGESFGYDTPYDYRYQSEYIPHYSKYDQPPYDQYSSSYHQPYPEYASPALRYNSAPDDHHYSSGARSYSRYNPPPY